MGRRDKRKRKEQEEIKECKIGCEESTTFCTDPEKEVKKKKKVSLATKIYFGLFIFSIVLCVFLFWAVRNAAAEEFEGTTLIAAIIALCLAIFFGLMSFVRYLRSRTVAGGIFLTTALSTGVFLGASRFIGVLIPPAAFAMAAEPGAETAGGFSLMVIFAQIGLFAAWFAFLMFTIHAQVSPIKKVDRCIEKILAGDEIKRVRIGKSKQYKELEQKLVRLSQIRKEEKEIVEEGASS
ncbi:MAG: hypothetical protein FWE45_00045 [Firmicutes bacterium]|nr:hypothetical protein [Bacillota bacterium]